MQKLTDKECWKAVTNRDERYDGRFVFGVITTGIYCRPSCSSRLAKCENVRFYESSMAAEQAGLRACKRCRPDSQGPGTVVERMKAVANYIEKYADEAIPLSRLSKEFSLSTYHLQRSFKSIHGVSPKEYQSAARLKKFKSSLKAGDGVAGAIYAAGYGSSSRIYEQVDGRLGMTPSAYREGGQDEEISYAIRNTAMGLLIMAATNRGVCFIHFGCSKTELSELLKKEYPKAKLIESPNESSTALNLWIEALDQYITSQGPQPELPLHLNGTAFQMKVWRFLMSIREGHVLSYAEVAKGIGSPKAVRAAASACASNNIAVLIPCHRVLRGDGSLGGYRWGLDRKRALLDAERSKKNSPRGARGE